MDITNEGEEEEEDDNEDGQGPSKAQKKENDERVPVDLSKFNVKGDNRDINDNQQMQTMTESKISTMKEEGATGQDIIDKLIQNSTTFSMKTQFSKAKWLKKKAEKYLVTFEVRKPSSLEICEAYFLCYPDRTCHLRPDMLGYMLQMANISAESKVLIVENTRGFIPAVMMEKQVKYGLRVEFCTKSLKYFNDIAIEMDMSTADHSRIGSINSSLLIGDDLDPIKLAMKKKYKKKFSSFVFAHDTLDPMEVFNAISYLLQPGASFAIFGVHPQPLTLLQAHLEKEKAAQCVNMKLEELWTREAQVLPLRTHPFMSMHGKSGFCLSGIKLA